MQEASPPSTSTGGPATCPAGVLNPVWAGTAVAAATSEEQVVAALLEVEAAWGEVLAEAGLASAASAQQLRALAVAPTRHGITAAEIAASAVAGGNPVIPLLDRVRRSMAGAGVDQDALHRAATSQDVLDTALVLLLREGTELILGDLRRAAAALAQLTETHRHTVCAARTLTQHALPTTMGLRFAGWLEALVEAGGRLQRSRDGLRLQWGGAVGTQAALADLCAVEGSGAQQATELTDRLAEHLGLPRMGRPWHTQRQAVLEFASAAAGVLAALGKAASDVLTLQRPEIGELSEPRAEERGGSSAMPQKRNPVLSTLIRSAALTGPGLLTGLHHSAAAAVDERPDGAWHAEWPQLLELLRLAGGAAARAADLYEGLEVFGEAAAANLGWSGDLVVSERLASRLGAAHSGGPEALKRVIAEASQDGNSLRDVLREELPAGTVSAEELDQLLDPAGYLGRAEDFIGHTLSAADQFLGREDHTAADTKGDRH